MGQIQVVGVLFDLQGVTIPRLVCRVSIDGDTRDYHLFVDRRTAREVDQLLQERPFRALRLRPSEGASLTYVGDLFYGPSIDEPIPENPPERQTLYLELSHGRSRRKYKLEVPEQVIQQFHWLLGLTAHDTRHARVIIEG